VTICACTFRRPDGLRRLLTGISELTFQRIPAPDIDVVICDNEGSAEARQICESFLDSGRLRVRYLHESRPGISYGRNRCLESLSEDCELFAMIDDDEWPAPDWLEALLAALDQTGADVARGVVIPEFPQGTPAWIRDGGMFGFPEARTKIKPGELPDLQDMPTAATHNVLVRTASARRLGLTFDPSLGLTGGEDDLFFKQMHKAGCRIVFAAQARVYEWIPPQRANLNYLMRSMYGRGHCHALVNLALKAGDDRAARRRVRRQTMREGANHVLRSLMRVLRPVGHMRQFRPSLLKAAYGCGLLAAALGSRYQHYGTSS
jgi:glycosyltransferase involved in cell wall biosynthesis